MQAQLLRSNVLSRAVNPLLGTSQASRIPQRSLSLTTTKRAGEADARSPAGNKNYPLYAILAFAVSLPLFYIYSSNKPSSSGRQEIDAKRRSEGTSGEFRDPRDSGVKTIEDKKRKESS